MCSGALFTWEVCYCEVDSMRGLPPQPVDLATPVCCALALRQTLSHICGFLGVEWSPVVHDSRLVPHVLLLLIFCHFGGMIGLCKTN